MDRYDAPLEITGLEWFVCPMPMPHPVRLGTIEYETRDFVALRLLAASGTEGHALGYSRGAPVGEAIDMLAGAVIGRPFAGPAAVADRIQGLFVPGWASLARGRQPHRDCGLGRGQQGRWGAAAPLPGRAAGSRPTHGGGRYFQDRRTIEDILEEVASVTARGFRTVKLLADGLDIARDIELVARARELCDDDVRLGLDVHYAWRSLEQAAEACAALDSLGLAFIEDPCPPGRRRMIQALARRMRTPLAAGEDLVDVSQYEDLAELVGVLRVDATVTGGLQSAWSGADAAACAGCAVIPHVFPGVHGPLVAAHPAATDAEVILPECGTDPFYPLLAAEPVIVDGELVLSTAPGHGLQLEWVAVAEHASRGGAAGRSPRVDPASCAAAVSPRTQERGP